VADLETIFGRSNDNQGIRMMTVMLVGFLFSRASEADVPFAPEGDREEVLRMAKVCPDFAPLVFDMHVSVKDNTKKVKTLLNNMGVIGVTAEEVQKIGGAVDISPYLAKFGGSNFRRFFEEGALIAEGQEYGKDPYMPIVQAARLESEKKGGKRNRSAKERERFTFTATALAEWAEEAYGEEWANHLREAAEKGGKKKKVASKKASEADSTHDAKRRKGEGKKKMAVMGEEEEEKEEEEKKKKSKKGGIKKKRGFSDVE
jgi:hypothetical protein